MAARLVLNVLLDSGKSNSGAGTEDHSLSHLAISPYLDAFSHHMTWKSPSNNVNCDIKDPASTRPLAEHEVKDAEGYYISTLASLLMFYYFLLAIILFAMIWAGRRRQRTQPERTPEHGAQNGKDGGRESSQNGAGVLSSIGVRGGPISSLVFFAGGKCIAGYISGDAKIRLWRVENDHMEEMHSIEPPGGTNTITASRDGRWIVSGDDSGRVAIWDMETQPRTVANPVTREHADKITALDVSPDSLRVATGSENGTVIMWNLETRDCLAIVQRPDNLSTLSTLKFSPAGAYIATGYRYHGQDTPSILIWNSRTGVQLKPIKNRQPTYSVAWSVDGQYLFAGGQFGSVGCFEFSTGHFLFKFEAPHTDLITSLCMSSSGQFLIAVSSGHSKSVDIWDIRKPPFPARMCYSLSGASVAAITSDDTRLVSREDNFITLRSIPTMLKDSYLFHRLFVYQSHSEEPFTYISNAAFEAWKDGKLVDVEEILSKEIKENRHPDIIKYTYANRALVRIRRKNWHGALDDVSKTGLHLLECIVRGIAFRGLGDDEAGNAFTLENCDNNVSHFVECVKYIALFDIENPRSHVSDHLRDGDLYPFVTAWKHSLLAYHHRDECRTVHRLLRDVEDLSKLLHAPNVKTISLIFGLDLHRLISNIHLQRCQALLESSPVSMAINYFSTKRAGLSEHTEGIKAKLSSLSEGFGDEASSGGRYDVAIDWYTEALALADYPLENGTADDGAVAQVSASLPRCPQCISHLLEKRSKARAQKGHWGDSLTDAKSAMEYNSSNSRGKLRKYLALHGTRDYKGAFDTLCSMFSNIGREDDPDILVLYDNYTKACNEIDKMVDAIFDESPFVLIDVRDGRLYDLKERKDRFKKDLVFHKLVSSMSMKLVVEDIRDIVKKYSLYVMFSHTWEEVEPTYDDISGKSSYDQQNEKLRKFCTKVRDDYPEYKWLWSDTCCINKKDTDIYNKSIRFMYKWYSNSALTLVLLARPSRSRKLKHNKWMFRAWTLQELLAPPVIRFYDREWGLYENDNSPNHKQSDKIKAELAEATKIDKGVFDNFSPEKLSVRHRLCLASTREATVKVDVAYSLIGIFSSDIHVEYTREADVALGVLLQEIVNRQGDVTVLDWVGKPSRFNSCLPAEITVYSQPPFALPNISDDQVQAWQSEHPDWKQETTSLYSLLSTLGLPRFADRRLSLPCITFSVTELKRGQNTCIASTRTFGDVEFQTSDAFFGPQDHPQQRLVLVYPWIRDLIAAIRHRGTDKYDRASRVMVYLERGFRAFLFAEQSDQQYKRVATELEIRVPACRLRSVEDVGVEVLEIWERS